MSRRQGTVGGIEWRRVPIGQVAKLNPKRGAWDNLENNDLVSFVPMQAVSEETAAITTAEDRPLVEVRRGYTAFQEQDVLFAKITPCMENGKLAIARGLSHGVGFGSTEFHVLRASPVLLPEYLCYFIRQSAFRAAAKQQMTGSAGQQRVPEAFLRKSEIPLPPLSEQRRIVEILDQADRLRRLRAEADAKADRILPALFIKMFGDPAANPMGWPVDVLGKMLVQVERRNPSDWPDESFEYIDIAGVDGTSGEVVTTRRLLGAEAPSRARQLVRARDVLVSTVRPYLRATAMVPDELDGQICSTGFCVLRSIATYAHGYLYALSRMGWFTVQLNARAKGASYPAVIDRDVWDLRVPVPGDHDLLGRFNDMVQQALCQKRSQRELARRIEGLFASLQARAFSGTLTAFWREAHMKDLLQEMEHQAKALATG